MDRSTRHGGLIWINGEIQCKNSWNLRLTYSAKDILGSIRRRQKFDVTLNLICTNFAKFPSALGELGTKAILC